MCDCLKNGKIVICNNQCDLCGSCIRPYELGKFLANHNRKNVKMFEIWQNTIMFNVHTFFVDWLPLFSKDAVITNNIFKVRQ